MEAKALRIEAGTNLPLVCPARRRRAAGTLRGCRGEGLRARLVRRGPRICSRSTPRIGRAAGRAGVASVEEQPVERAPRQQGAVAQCSPTTTYWFVDELLISSASRL